MKEENMPLGITLSNRTKTIFVLCIQLCLFQMLQGLLCSYGIQFALFLTNSIEQTQIEAYKCLKFL